MKRLSGFWSVLVIAFGALLGLFYGLYLLLRMGLERP